MAKPNLEDKDVLNPQEAIEYWNFSRRKFLDFLEQTDGGDFLAYYKKRKVRVLNGSHTNLVATGLMLGAITVSRQFTTAWMQAKPQCFIRQTITPGEKQKEPKQTTPRMG